ncbi:MAG TPA: hypothetical protein VGZ01_03575, partial [Trinickia sp.]|nr:hypothetical protein [Trinickia sp.]
LAELGRELAPGLYERELVYLRETEWACCANDVLWRRSKLGLHVAPGSIDAVRAAVDEWFAQASQASRHAPLFLQSCAAHRRNECIG